MAAEYCAVARIRQLLAEVPMRYLKFLKTDCLGFRTSGRAGGWPPRTPWAGGKVAKGTFVRVAEADAERRARRWGCRSSPIYASCQGLTLRGRVCLLDCGTQHFNLRHLYVGASRATSTELLSVL